MRKGQTIVLVGGGRWGRVHGSNLGHLLTPDDRVLWVSRHNTDGLRNTIEKSPADGPRFEVLEGFEDALAKRPTSALIITAPNTHAAITHSCLRRGIHAFVEKPLAFKAEEARVLVDLANIHGLVLAVGVHLLSASYLRHFKSLIEARDITRISIRWFDPMQEVRHGEIKRADNSTTLVQDIYPHIWSIVCVLIGDKAQVVTDASRQADGSLLFQSLAGSTRIDAQCGRHAAARERKVGLVFRDGGTGIFDFTQEPGSAVLDATALPIDPSWGRAPPPVMAEVKDFLEQVSSPVRDPNWPHLAGNCLDSVVGAEALQSKLA